METARNAVISAILLTPARKFFLYGCCALAKFFPPMATGPSLTGHSAKRRQNPSRHAPLRPYVNALLFPFSLLLASGSVRPWYFYCSFK
jgi:hypothetical protein